MSKTTAAEHSQAVEKIDLAVRNSLSKGDIVKTMEDLDSEIKKMFKGKREATRGHDAEAVKVFAMPRFDFLWGFLFDFKNTGDHGDNFLMMQRSLLATHEKQLATAKRMPTPKPANSPPPQQPSRGKASKVGLSGETRPAGPAEKDRLAEPDANPGRGETKGQGGPTGKKRTRGEASSEGEETWGLGGTKAKRARGRNPLAEAELEAEADARPQRLQTRRNDTTRDDSDVDNEYTEGEGKEGGTRSKGKEVRKPTDDVDESVRPRKSRPVPIKGDTNPDPCKRCRQAGEVCFAQLQGRGRGACYKCGTMKVKCSLKDESENVTRKKAMKATTPTMPTEQPPMKPNVKPRPKPTLKKSKRSKQPKTPIIVPDSDGESEAPVTYPTKTSSRATSSALSVSPARLTAAQKRKGKAISDAESDAVVAEIGIMRVASQEQRIVELEEKVEELQATVESLRETVETHQEAFERLARDWLHVTEHLGLEAQSHALPAGYLPSTVDDVTAREGDKTASPSASISASASPRPGCAEKVHDPTESADNSTLPVEGEPSAATANEGGASAMPGVVLIPPTPQTSQEVAVYQKVPLVIPADHEVMDSAGDGVEETPGDRVQEMSGDARVSDQAEPHADADAEPHADADEPSTAADAKAAELEPGPQIFQPAQLLAPPSNTDPSSPGRRSRSRSRSRHSPIPLDQLRRSPRFRSVSPAAMSSPLTSTPSSPTPMPRSPSRLPAKRALAEESENDSSSKRPRKI